MVRPEDYWRVKLIDKRIIDLHALADSRQGNAVARRRRPGYGAPEDPVLALRLNAVGVYGECANMLHANRVFQDFCVRWHRFKPEGFHGLPDLEVHPFGKPAFAFMDSKTNKQKYAINYLQVTDDAKDDWIYFLSYVENFPTICTVGWCTGKLAKTSRKWALDPRRPESFNTPHDADILRPMKELRKYALEQRK